MGDLSVKITQNRIPIIARESPAKVDRLVAALAEMGRGQAVLLLNTQTSGKSEKRYNPTRTVTVSEPGDAPNTDTGALANSITVQPAGHLARVIAVGAEHGEWLEFGTADMAARPFMTPMSEWLQRQVNRPGLIPSILGSIG